MIINSRLRVLLFLMSSFVFVSNNASAVAFYNLMNNIDQVTRNQDRALYLNKIKQQKKQATAKRLSFQPIKTKGSKKVVINKCYKINSFAIDENSTIKQRQFDEVTEKYIGKCFAVRIINDIKDELNSLIVDKGYVTSYALFPAQNVIAGKLKFKIFEGKIESVKIGDGKAGDRMQSFMLFGFAENQKLNIDDINQGLHQMRKLPSSNAKLKIEPATRVGYSNVVIENDRSIPFSANVAYDNLGNDFTGRDRVSGSIATENLLNLSESIELSGNSAINNGDDKGIKTSNFAITIPYRYYTISFNYSNANYKGTVSSLDGDFLIIGSSKNRNISIDKSLVNSKLLTVNLLSTLSIKSTSNGNYLRGLVSSNNKNLSALNISLLMSKKFKNNINIFVRPSINKGLTYFDADRDSSQTGAQDPKNQFLFYKLYFSASKAFKLKSLSSRILFATEFDSQISRDVLHGSEQFSVGGYFSVRGFADSYLSGDHGYFIRNKVNLHLGSLLAGLTNNNLLQNSYIEPFFDYGAVRNRVVAGGGRLSGAGIKIINNSRFYSSSVTYSRALGRSQLLDQYKNENHSVYLQLSINCC